MSAVIILTSPTGSIEFSEATGYDPPLISRRLDWNRLGEQGNSIQRVTCEMAGFFTGGSNADITTLIDLLMEVLKSNIVTLYYHDGARVVIDQQRCYIVGYGDPTEWKEYTGEYAISLYWFQEPLTDTFSVSWQPLIGSAYEFPAAPVLGRAYKNNRRHPNEPTTTFDGVSVGNQITIRLEGQLFADTPEDLEVARLALCAAFDQDGTLNYGTFYSQQMRVISYDIPPVLPMNWLNYGIELSYTSNTITEFSAGREFTLTHQNPLIRENLLCPVVPTVTLRNTSGQYVTYNVRASGYDISVLRQFLANELSLMIYAGGTLVDGGREKWDEYGNEPAVSMNATLFYPVPVIDNLF